MRTLLVADDERNIRLGLKAMIEREYPGRYRVLLAGDGRQALALFERERPEVVVTDIRMPEMDGIELIRELSALPDAPALLILSGYDDFAYAKEAIRHKVREYLLKPIVREDLFAALNRIEADLERAEAVNSRLEATEKYREGMQLSTLRYVWSSPGVTGGEAEAKCREAGLGRFAPSYRVGILEASGHQRHLIRCRQYLRGLGRDGDWLAIENEDGRLCVLTADPALFEGMAADLAASPGTAGTFAAGLSGEGRSLAEMRAKYEEAHYALKHRVLLGPADSALIRYDAVKVRVSSRRVPEETVRKLANMLGTGRDQEMKALLMELLGPEALTAADIGYCEEACRLLNEWVFDEAFRTYGEASVEVLKTYRLAGSLYHFPHIRDYFHAVEGLLSALDAYIRDLKSVHDDQNEMARAIAYIQAHYDKDLTMAVVSNHVSLNYSYFSERFKEYTGESFTNYVKKVRIGKAKELLAQTNDRVYEISRKVGFDNPKQFNRVFRESEGITAMEFRQKRAAAHSLPTGNENVYNGG
jgi:two-component system response regulator YesN